MAIEPRRGCGFRKVGGLYLVCKGGFVSCDRLPLPLHVCPTCGHGIKQARGWTWLDVPELVGGVHPNCADDFPCPLCMDPQKIGRAGLLWIGEKFYRTPEEFMREADALGISRRIAAVPRGFRLGETWVLLAHSRAISAPATCENCGFAPMLHPVKRKDHTGTIECDTYIPRQDTPGIFRVFKPTAIEKIITETESKDSKVLAELQNDGITPIVVPDDDPDHRGSVHDKTTKAGLFDE